jgi:hypothetical protein
MSLKAASAGCAGAWGVGAQATGVAIGVGTISRQPSSPRTRIGRGVCVPHGSLRTHCAVSPIFSQAAHSGGLMTVLQSWLETCRGPKVRVFVTELPPQSTPVKLTVRERFKQTS